MAAIEHEICQRGPLDAVKCLPMIIGAHHFIASEAGQLFAGFIPEQDAVILVDHKSGCCGILYQGVGKKLLIPKHVLRLRAHADLVHKIRIDRQDLLYEVLLFLFPCPDSFRHGVKIFFQPREFIFSFPHHGRCRKCPP